MVEINRKTTQECKTAMNFDFFLRFLPKRWGETELPRLGTELPGQLKTVLDSTGRAKECETLVLETRTGNAGTGQYWTVEQETLENYKAGDNLTAEVRGAQIARRVSRALKSIRGKNEPRRQIAVVVILN